MVAVDAVGEFQRLSAVFRRVVAAFVLVPAAVVGGFHAEGVVGLFDVLCFFVLDAPFFAGAEVAAAVVRVAVEVAVAGQGEVFGGEDAVVAFRQGFADGDEDAVRPAFNAGAAIDVVARAVRLERGFEQAVTGLAVVVFAVFFRLGYARDGGVVFAFVGEVVAFVAFFRELRVVVDGGVGFFVCDGFQCGEGLTACVFVFARLRPADDAVVAGDEVVAFVIDEQYLQFAALWQRADVVAAVGLEGECQGGGGGGGFADVGERYAFGFFGDAVGEGCRGGVGAAREKRDEQGEGFVVHRDTPCWGENWRKL